MVSMCFVVGSQWFLNGFLQIAEFLIKRPTEVRICVWCINLHTVCIAVCQDPGNPGEHPKNDQNTLGCDVHLPPFLGMVMTHPHTINLPQQNHSTYFMLGSHISLTHLPSPAHSRRNSFAKPGRSPTLHLRGKGAEWRQLQGAISTVPTGKSLSDGWRWIVNGLY